MTAPIKLSIKELEDYIRYQDRIFVNGTHFPTRIARQLLDIMRELESAKTTIEMLYESRQEFMMENEENCRIIGMSGETELALRSENDRLVKTLKKVEKYLDALDSGNDWGINVVNEVEKALKRNKDSGGSCSTCGMTNIPIDKLCKCHDQAKQPSVCSRCHSAQPCDCCYSGTSIKDSLPPYTKPMFSVHADGSLHTHGIDDGFHADCPTCIKSPKT